MVKMFVHQQRLGRNKILSNRVKVASARASETKSVWVFYGLFVDCPMRRSYKPLCATFNLPLQCHCLQGVTQFCRAKTFITLPKLLAKLRPWSALKDVKI